MPKLNLDYLSEYERNVLEEFCEVRNLHEICHMYVDKEYLAYTDGKYLVFIDDKCTVDNLVQRLFSISMCRSRDFFTCPNPKLIVRYHGVHIWEGIPVDKLAPYLDTPESMPVGSKTEATLRHCEALGYEVVRLKPGEFKVEDFLGFPVKHPID